MSELEEIDISEPCDLCHQPPINCECVEETVETIDDRLVEAEIDDFLGTV
jgi:hypothetical protein